MIAHVVLLRPGGDVPEQDIHTALDHVRALKEVIPGLISIDTGVNLSTANQGYTHDFIMHFGDQLHLGWYARHEAHQPVSRELQSLCESIIDFDVETTS